MHEERKRKGGLRKQNVAEQTKWIQKETLKDEKYALKKEK